MDPYSTATSMMVSTEIAANGYTFQTYFHFTEGTTTLGVDY